MEVSASFLRPGMASPGLITRMMLHIQKANPVSLGLFFAPFATVSSTCDDEVAKGHWPIFELIECQDTLSHHLHKHTSLEPVQVAAEV